MHLWPEERNAVNGKSHGAATRIRECKRKSMCTRTEFGAELVQVTSLCFPYANHWVGRAVDSHIGHAGNLLWRVNDTKLKYGACTTDGGNDCASAGPHLLGGIRHGGLF